MAEFKATPSQRAAIDSRGCTLLVSAGAGSGKTRVLTQRLIERMTDADAPIEIDRVLISTFTRAAAAELKGRITAALGELLATDPGNRRLRRQSALCRKAQIGTIHAFCTALLRENSQALALPPDFRVLEENRTESMKAAALERVLEDWYAAPEEHPGFLLLADTVGAGRDDRRLASLALTLHGKMQSHARPEQWAEQQRALLETDWHDAGETPWGRELLRWCAEQADYWSAETDRLLAALKETPRLFAFFEPRLSAVGEAMRELSRCTALGWDRTAEACRAVSFRDLRGLKKDEDPALAAHVQERWGSCKKTVEKMADALDGSSQELLDELKRTAPAMSALLALALALDERYTADKRRQALLDFSDLEHLAARLLTEDDGSPSPAAREIAGRYDEIMVDEYQDVSPVQELIFRALSPGENKRFLVGDVKQSIYRFRLADPTIFTKKYDAYPLYAEARGDEPRKILLRENFRSRREVIDAANSVFSRCMSRAVGDVDYDEKAALICGAAFDDPGVPLPELFLLGCGEEDEDAPDRLSAEAAFVAEKIRSLVDGGATVRENGETRPLRYGDVAILMSAANSTGAVYRRVLTEHGVPVAAGQGAGYFRSAEISTALSMLAVLDNPHQDIALIAVLRSPVFGFTPDELTAIRGAGKKMSFFEALRLRAESDGKSRAFLARIEALRAQAADLSAEELVWEILDGMDFLSVYSAMADGAQRRANLLALAGLAQSCEAGGYRGLHRFVLFLRRLAEQGASPAGGAGEEAVQILTIHKSKGLEFPVVFLCDTTRRFNLTETRETVLVHPELGLGPKLTDLEKRVEYPTLARRAIARRLEREVKSEQMRLLYVALTRAKERLYITAAVKDPEKRMDKLWQTLGGERTDALSPQLVAEQSSFADWLLLAAAADGGAHLRLVPDAPAAAQTAEEAQDARQAPDEDALRALERNLSFRYPHAEAESLPSKLTATELKGRRETDEDAAQLNAPTAGVFRLPDFTRKDRPLSGAQRGTATHLLLQYMDLAAASDREALRAEVERLRQKRVLSDREAEAVDLAAVEKLFASPLGQRILNAGHIEREFKFSLLCDAQELCGAGRGEQVLLQGVVDCCIESEGALTVIDYKTDAVRGEQALAERAAYYGGQLRAYAAALERIFGKPVREALLYFLAAGRTVPVDLRPAETKKP